MSVISVVLLHLLPQLLGRPAAEERLLVVVQLFDVFQRFRKVRAESFRQQQREEAAEQGAAAEDDERNVVGSDSGQI